MHYLLPQTADAVDRMAFPELDALRRVLGITQAEICREAEINPTTYSRWVKLVDTGQGPTWRPTSIRAVRAVLRDRVAEKLSGRQAAAPVAAE